VVADGEKEAAAQLICEKLPEPRRAAIGVVIRRRRRQHRQRANRVVHAAREDGRESRQRQLLPSGVQMASVAEPPRRRPRREMHSTAASVPSQWANCGTE